jgi:ribonuclease G
LANEILVEVSSEETRVAIIEDRELVEYYTEKAYGGRLVGNIYKGKVQSVLPGMQAAFVDIGYSKNAFLYIKDAVADKFNINPHTDDDTYSKNSENDSDDKVDNLDNFDNCKRSNDIFKENSNYKNDISYNSKDYNINQILKQGQVITVQVIKDPMGSKGPRVTTHITLPGRYVVLVPGVDYIGISRKISNDYEKNRLKKIAEKIRPSGMGIIMRTIAEGKDEEDFQNDIKFLTQLWQNILEREKGEHAPRCLHTDYNLLFRTIRDFFTPEIDKLIINDLDQYKKALEYAEVVSPALKSRIELFKKSKSLFDYYQIDYRLKRDLARKIWLKCGGYIIIDKAEALTVIDVNTGKYIGADNPENTIVKTNLEAATEIARQIRLRNIGGIIVIDFIDMNLEEHKKTVIEELKNALKKDRAKTTVVGMTGLGLIEMTRKKVGD